MARNRRTAAMFEPAIARRAVAQAFVKLDPRVMIRVPVMFLVEIGSVRTRGPGRPSIPPASRSPPSSLASS